MEEIEKQISKLSINDNVILSEFNKDKEPLSGTLVKENTKILLENSEDKELLSGTLVKDNTDKIVKQSNNLTILENIEEYPNNEILVNLCKSFEEQEITLTAIFMGQNIQIYNCNAVGDILEDIFYPVIKDKLDDFEEGPKQASPDYYGINKNFEFEQKVFMKHPCFDIGNFTSYVNILCKDGGVYKKLFKTKYLIFEYEIINKRIKIIKFHYLNVYNLVGYSGKTPITMQIKKNIWYNIRPDSVKKWYSSTKTPQMFIEKIIECINKCPHIVDKINKITSINNQFDNIKLKYRMNLSEYSDDK
jgi:hypothetical protein